MLNNKIITRIEKSDSFGSIYLWKLFSNSECVFKFMVYPSFPFLERLYFDSFFNEPGTWWKFPIEKIDGIEYISIGLFLIPRHLIEEALILNKMK